MSAFGTASKLVTLGQIPAPGMSRRPPLCKCDFTSEQLSRDCQWCICKCRLQAQRFSPLGQLLGIVLPETGLQQLLLAYSKLQGKSVVFILQSNVLHMLKALYVVLQRCRL